jgi:hypothetical protein
MWSKNLKYLRENKCRLTIVNTMAKCIIIIIIICIVKEDSWKHTLMIKPYCRLITMTGPGLKVSKI